MTSTQHPRLEDFLEAGSPTSERVRQRLQALGLDDPSHPIAYFCMEYGLHESLALYSGGLGMLAGDHLKTATDLGIPLVGVGILWREGYFRQGLSEGRQTTSYAQTSLESLPYTRVEVNGQPLRIELPPFRHEGKLLEWGAHVWELPIGRVRLLLLDTDIEENPPISRDLTQRLYSGGSDERCAQEVILGIGGARALQALDIHPTVHHCNEGHSAFLALALSEQNGAATNGWTTALRSAREQIVFTTHTPVPAGHDRFEHDTIDRWLGSYATSLGASTEALLDLGRQEPGNTEEPLCMTILALRTAKRSNGVSALHGEVSRAMWSALWTDERAGSERLGLPPVPPIGAVTNGVHLRSWISPEAIALFEEHVGDWRCAWEDPEQWARRVSTIPDAVLWSLRRVTRERLISEIERRTSIRLDPDLLTLGFARRFATYKRAGLLFSDPDRLASVLDAGPAQLVFAGKAHPADVPGQALIAEIVRWSRDPRFEGRLVFVPGYDMALGRAMVQGADVWLNTPRRPREASGTSGQKAAAQGVLHCSILDGWWPEAFDESNGWAIGGRTAPDDPLEQDRADIASLYDVLENSLIPTWTTRDANGLPTAWLNRMRRSIGSCLPRFDSNRMLFDYLSIYGE